MSELSGTLGGSAPKHVLKVGDREYHVSLITQNVKVAFEKALYSKARESLASIRSITDKEYYDSRMDALVDKYQEGYFSMESPYGQKALGKIGGSVLLLSILMDVPEILVFQIVAEDPSAVSSMLKTVMKESFPGVNIDKLEADLRQAEAEAATPASSPENPAPKVLTEIPAPLG